MVTITITITDEQAAKLQAASMAVHNVPMRQAIRRFVNYTVRRAKQNEIIQQAYDDHIFTDEEEEIEIDFS